MSDNKTKTIDRYRGWEIKEVTNSKGKYYMAYFDLGYDKMPLMLSEYDLETLKRQLDSVYVIHGKLMKNTRQTSQNFGG